MSQLSLNELLDSVGINKSVLAKLLGVSRSTVMRMKDEVSDEVLEVIDKYKSDMTSEESEKVPVSTVEHKPVTEIEHSIEILPVTHRNIALSCTWHDLDNIEVARRFNLSVFDYNFEVKNTVAYCAKEQTSFMELRG